MNKKKIRFINIVIVAAIVLLAVLQIAVVGTEDGDFEVNGAGRITALPFELFGMELYLTTSVTVQWVVMLLLGVFFFFLGRNLKEKPESKRQIIAEFIVSFFNNTVRDSMGEKYYKYAPYIGALFCFSMFSSLSGLLGFRPPTADISTIAAWGIITFFLVQRNKLKTGGLKGAAKSFIDPVAPLLPLNILGCFTDPLSQSFRHFGNIMAGMIIMSIIYWALGSLAIFIPAVLSLYFDIFGSVIQAFIFVTLTMSYVSMADCSSD
ncbi:MAG: F0F1 ATP synthase subunit A [Oscillospiraceae bacterium]|nr:F0F1 ATP synthase subunit A [Oscillospiraceae bacterium]